MSRAVYDPELFYPLEGQIRRSRFATIDLESKDGTTEKAGFTRPFLAGFYDGRLYQGFTDTNPGGDPMTRWWRPGGCVDRLMHCCLTRDRMGLTYYCHNGGGFDFLFLLVWLMRHVEPMGLAMNLVPVGHSRLLSMHIRVKGQKWGGWKFVDSLRTLPMKLADAGKALELGGKFKDDEGDFDLNSSTTDPRWRLYNERDCVLLYDVMDKAHDIVEHQFGGEMGLTAPATAMKVFRRQFLHEPIYRDTATHAFVREGYFGGRTEWLISEGHFLSYYDVNSSYPHAMTKAMPVGDAQSWGASEPPEQWKNTRIGFCRVTVRVPEDIVLPPLPVRADGAHFPQNSGLDGKLLFPVGVLKGVWEWDELQNAIENGCEILEWHESVWYKAGPLLAEFVTELYKYRDKAHCFRCYCKIGNDYHCDKCNEPGYLLGLDQWAKLMLNSLYGKTGQRPERTSFHYRGDPDLPEGSLPLVAEDPNCPLWVAQTEVDSPFIMPQIAARVTAIARVTLYRAAKQAMKSVVRECWTCHSKVTYRGEKRGTGWVLGSRVGGSGTHGDSECAALGIAQIGPQGSVCPCGGSIETRNGRVFYMDTDSIVTDAHLETGKALGQLKDEVPRFSGFVHGRFYANKMYHLSVEPGWLAVDELVRKAMMRRDGSYLSSLGIPLDDAARNVPNVDPKDAKSPAKRASEWWSVRSKGLTKKRRTPENLARMYEGALARLEWSAKPENRYADGSVRPLPPELEAMGTVVDERLEQFGALAALVETDESGQPVLHEESDGYLHVTATPFARGPLMTNVPRRLHLEGAKRRVLANGETRPWVIDMTMQRPDWFQKREERRAELRALRLTRPYTARVSKPQRNARAR
jgi:hypothetical protein